MENKYPEIDVEGRKIGRTHRPLLIAEIGINHGGELSVAKAMVDAACRAGVEVIKHQTHIVEDEYSSEAKLVIPAHTKDSIYEIMRRCSLSKDEEYELLRYTKSRGMIFISTPFSRLALERLLDFDIPAIKVGSGECNNYPLLELIAKSGKTTILSTGMNSIESVSKALKIFKPYNSNVAILHTTNLYPTPHKAVRLSAMMDMHMNFPEYVFGLSDHTTDSISSLGAAAIGASIIERHFTDSKKRNGPDIICSMDEYDAAKLIRDLARMHECIGLDEKKIPHPEENKTADFAFASVVAVRDIREGQIIKIEDVWVKRPGNGKISAGEMQSVIGKKAIIAIKADTQISWEMLR